MMTKSKYYGHANVKYNVQAYITTDYNYNYLQTMEQLSKAIRRSLEQPSKVQHQMQLAFSLNPITASNYVTQDNKKLPP